ncbi:MAG: hypothetical protein QMD86_00760 [Patescibacteria group bacterium]|nr:hypothetical protein [Patescibacteria group bacterium]
MKKTYIILGLIFLFFATDSFGETSVNKKQMCRLNRDPADPYKPLALSEELVKIKSPALITMEGRSGKQYTCVLPENTDVVVAKDLISGKKKGKRIYLCGNPIVSDLIINESEQTKISLPVAQEIKTPIVKTLQAIRSASADTIVLSGDVDPQGSETKAWFEWSFSEPDKMEFSSASVNIGTNPMEMEAAIKISGKIWYRLVGKNSAGTAYGKILEYPMAGTVMLQKQQMSQEPKLTCEQKKTGWGAVIGGAVGIVSAIVLKQPKLLAGAITAGTTLTGDYIDGGCITAKGVAEAIGFGIISYMVAKPKPRISSSQPAQPQPSGGEISSSPSTSGVVTNATTTTATVTGGTSAVPPPIPVGPAPMPGIQ